MRRTIVLLAAMAAIVVAYAGAALAAEVHELEPNDSIATAQNIDASFSLHSDHNITDSTTVPHATIHGTGNYTFDFYRFTVPEAGVNKISVFDMDQDPAQFQNNLRLYNSNGVLIAYSDDSTSSGFYPYNDPGSAWTQDSYLRYEFTEAGTYYIKVSEFNAGPTSPDMPIPPTTHYKLNVSIPNHEVIDNIAPRVTSTFPHHGSLDVLKTANVTATFSEAVQNVNPNTFKLDRKVVTNKGTTYEPVAATVTTLDNHTKAVLDPTLDLLPRGEYHATLTSGVTDTAGNALSAHHTWTFKVSK